MLSEALILALSGMGTVLALLLLLQGLTVLSHRLCEKLEPNEPQSQQAVAGQEIDDPVLLEVIRAAVRQYRNEQQ